MINKKLKELGIEIKEAPKPLASYVPATKVDDLVYTAGQVPLQDGKLIYEGIVGKDLTLEEAKEAAKICAINCLGAVKSIIGDLELIEKIVKVTVFVANTPEFVEQPKVANGASDFLVEVFGDRGKHVRSAVGVSSLPINAPVEVEMIVQIKE